MMTYLRAAACVRIYYCQCKLFVPSSANADGSGSCPHSDALEEIFRARCHEAQLDQAADAWLTSLLRITEQIETDGYVYLIPDSSPAHLCALNSDREEMWCIVTASGDERVQCSSHTTHGGSAGCVVGCRSYLDRHSLSLAGTLAPRRVTTVLERAQRSLLKSASSIARCLIPGIWPKGWEWVQLDLASSLCREPDPICLAPHPSDDPCNCTGGTWTGATRVVFKEFLVFFPNYGRSVTLCERLCSLGVCTLGWNGALDAMFMWSNHMAISTSLMEEFRDFRFGGGGFREFVVAKKAVFSRNGCKVLFVGVDTFMAAFMCWESLRVTPLNDTHNKLSLALGAMCAQCGPASTPCACS